ncbi:YczE/YyaS/YitT family protein [Virgibacillus senegalensis]|uniref:YczE/YyaS/YitT family protein n=1 Tax=Virgibacillus senegalensis TaxID=1499679 RepID=UPI00069F2F3E|nr:membrane protein [Virgibacillus senegalensis]
MGKQLVIRWLFFIAGLIVLSFGISLTITADLGVGAWDAVNVGLSELTDFTVGNWVMIIGVVLIGVNAWLTRERPDYFAIVTILVVGMMIDFWLLVVMEAWELNGALIQAVILVVGILVLALGVALYLQPKLSLNPVDGLMVSLQKRWNLPLLAAKTTTEGLALVAALLIGGPVGIGTIVILVVIGPAIQFFEPKARKLMTRLLHSQG